MISPRRKTLPLLTILIIGQAGVVQAQFPAFFDTRDMGPADGTRFLGDRPGTCFGSAVAIGDVNLDGIPDFVCGAPCAGGPIGTTDYPGTVYVVFGSAAHNSINSFVLDVLDGTNGFRITGRRARGYFGYAVAAGFDWNHDGLDDIAVSEPEAHTSGHFFVGRVFVIFGQPGLGASGAFDLASLDGSNGFIINGPPIDDKLTGRTLSVGDFNGDSWPDLAIGSPGDRSGPRRGAGDAYVLFGGLGVGSTGSFDIASINGTNGFRIIGENELDLAYLGLGPIGDVNGDDIDDIAMGGTGVDALGRVDAGRCYVIFGSPTIAGEGLIDLRELAYPEGFVINGAEPTDGAYFIRGGGDVNGDDYTDITVGTRGELYVIYGGPSIGATGPIDLAMVGWPQGAKLRGLGSVPGSGIIGDVNHDGYDDVAVANSAAIPIAQFPDREGCGRVSIVYGAPDLGIHGPILAGTLFDGGEMDGTNGFGAWGDAAGRALGRHVFALGDVNDDGIADFGADATYKLPQENYIDRGALHVIHGRRRFDVADLDLDGDVDTRDFMYFAQCFGGSMRPPAGGCKAGVDADFDRDGDVDTADFGTFAQNFTGAK